jgi:hypothetical protein
VNQTRITMVRGSRLWEANGKTPSTGAFDVGLMVAIEIGAGFT